MLARARNADRTSLNDGRRVWSRTFWRLEPAQEWNRRAVLAAKTRTRGGKERSKPPRFMQRANLAGVNRDRPADKYRSRALQSHKSSHCRYPTFPSAAELLAARHGF